MKVLASKFVFVVIFVMYFVVVNPGLWIPVEYPLC